MSDDDTTRLPGSTLSSASFNKWMVTGVTLINLFVFGMFAFSLNQSFHEFDERAEVTAQTLSQMLAQDIGREFEKIDVTLLSATDEIARQDARGGINKSELNVFLGRLQGRIPEIITLRTTDASGIVAYGLGVNPNARPNNSRREYFIRQRDNSDAGLVVAKPEFVNSDKRWIVPFSRAIHLPDGSFGGVVYAYVALEQLSNLFPTIDVGRHGSVSLRDAEMRIFARYPIPKDADKVFGQKLDIPEFQELIQSGRPFGTYITNRTVDRVERKFAVNRISDYPLYAVIGRATDEYMARWKDQAVKTSALVVLFSATTLISSWLVYRNRRRQIAATLELVREEEKFHTVANYTYDWEYWEGPNQEMLFMSPSCERVTGYSQAEFMSDPALLYRIIHPDDLHLMAEHRRNAAHEDIGGVDFRIVRRDGVIRWIAHGCRPVFGEGDNFLGRRASNRDITERVQAEATVRQLNAELEQRVAQRTAQLEAMNKELEEFSYSMSHDMRTPLRALDGFSKILLEEHSASLDDEGKRLLQVLRDNAQRMGRLVDDILRFLKMGRLKIEFSSIDITKLSSEIFADLQNTFPARSLRLEIGILPPAWGDPDMIHQVVLNLLSNAIKFSPADVEALIEVGGENKGEENCYYVKDYGVGFDMRYADKLFRVFERVHPTGQYEGSGVGLAIVKRIVERHGGRVWAEGSLGKGATFYFALPNRQAGS